MRRATLLLLTLLSVLFAGASVPAIAGFGEDRLACINPGQDFDGEIAACDRQISSGRYRGNDRAVQYRNRGIKFMNRWSRMSAASDVASALVDFTRALEINPRYADAYVSRGKAHVARNDPDLAISDYSEAIRIDPRNVPAFDSRGDLYRVKGDNDRAIADFSDAIRLNPRNGFAYRNRGYVYGVKGDNDRAITDYNEAVRINPNDALARNNRGNVYLKKALNDRAIADLSGAIRLDPSFAAAFTNRGLAREATGKAALARDDFKAALALPEKYANGKWAHDKARERLMALDGIAPSAVATPALAAPASAAPVPAKPTITTIEIPKLNLAKSDAGKTTSAPPPTSAVTATVATTPAIAAAAAGSVSTASERRIALVIGNSSYLNVPILTNPKRDATLVADMLKRTGFESVTVLTDLRRDALLGALREFAARAETADWAVVYYAGHGMEVGGVNYLVPVDARIAADRDIEFEAVPLGQILNAAERAKKLRLVILDACRNNPFANKMKRTLNVASRSASQGLAAIEPEAGTLVVYAAKDGETALDGAGANSPFATALAKNLPTPGLEVRRLFDYVRDDVMELTRRKQKPFSYGSISGRQDFYFVAAK